MTIYLNADRSAIVPAGSAEAAFGIQPKDMQRLGFDKLPVLGAVELPEMPDPSVVLSSANTPVEEPVAEVKQAPKPANKAAKKPANKGKDA